MLSTDVPGSCAKDLKPFDHFSEGVAFAMSSGSDHSPTRFDQSVSLKFAVTTGRFGNVSPSALTLLNYICYFTLPALISSYTSHSTPATYDELAYIH